MASLSDELFVEGKSAEMQTFILRCELKSVLSLNQNVIVQP